MSSILSLFNPSRDLPPDFMLLMYGMRRAGKTTMLLHMLEDMKERFKFSQVHVFSGTADENPGQWKNFPPGYVTADISNIDVHIGDILRQQQEQIRQEVQNQVISKKLRVEGYSGKRKRGLDIFQPAKQVVTTIPEEPAIQNDTPAFAQDPYNQVPAGDTIYQLTDFQIIPESTEPREFLLK